MKMFKTLTFLLAFLVSMIMALPTENNTTEVSFNGNSLVERDITVSLF
jgi:hypothetical protein